MGSTDPCCRQLATFQDHPHIHGEHSNVNLAKHGALGSPPYTWGALYQVALSNPDWGSPPYTWGALDYLSARATQLGITPIYMGSTTGDVIILGRRGDHPHIHGEHITFLFVFYVVIGSPPYTWGALKLPASLVVPFRITPIYMGST